MRILISVEHPAHVHLFKNLATQLIDSGNDVFFICVDREFVVYLLDKYGFNYRKLGKHYKSMLGKVFGMIKYDFLTYRIIRQLKPDILLSHGSIYAAHASFFARKPNISLHDTFAMEQVRLSMPFTDVALTGDYPHPSLGNKDISYPGYHELAYLHPNVFTPDEEVLKRLGVSKAEKYAIVRFVAWNATHDLGRKGVSADNKRILIESLSSHMKVFVTSEDDLPLEFQQYRISVNAEDMHNALAFASLFIGESPTMATEAAVLGVPAVYINDSQLGYTDDLVKRGLLFSYSGAQDDQLSAIYKAIEIASSNNSDKFHKLRDIMLEDRIDVTSFLLWFILSYPKSFRELIHNGKYDFSRFKLTVKQHTGIS